MSELHKSDMISDIDKKLDNILVMKGLPIIEDNPEADEYINMSYNQLQDISGTKAEDISFILEQRAMHVQKMHNRLSAQLVQIESNLFQALSPVYDEYKTYGGFDIVLSKACAEYNHINELNEYKNEIKMQLLDIAYMSKHIGKMADKVSNMKWRNK